MRHEKLAFPDFLRQLRGDPALFPEERRLVDALLQIRESGSAEGEVLLDDLRRLVRALVARGHWEIISGSARLDEEYAVLRDPRRGVRYRLRLSPPASRAPERLPVPSVDENALPARVSRAILASPSELVSYDRILSPREILSKMERFLVEVVPARTARFHSMASGPDPAGPDPEGPETEGPEPKALGLAGPIPETLEKAGPAPAGTDPTGPDPKGLEPAGPIPADSDVRRPETVETDSVRHTLPLEAGETEDLSRERDHLYRWTPKEHGHARIILAIGDDTLGWRGILDLESETDFDPERIQTTVWIAHHYAELVSTVMRLQGLIFYDFLTGVYNRSFYEDQMDRELQLARRRQESLALLLIDIDDFKEFNTRHGYEGGDRVLATVACVLKSALRGTDTLARYGGEEFVVILAPPVSSEEAFRIADRLRQAVEQEEFQLGEFSGEAASARVTISIGGALYPRQGETRAALWTASNLQLLQAKREGKNRVLLAD